jgi:hypothetical protein
MLAGSGQAQTLRTPADLVGSWLYRSFFNRPEPITTPQQALDLIFGEGEFDIAAAANGKIAGTLSFGPSAVLDVDGTYQELATTVSVRMTGRGRAGTQTAGWVYDYIGFAVPQWPDGVNQRRTIVGSVIRTVPHNNQPAGVTASFVMVRK